MSDPIPDCNDPAGHVWTDEGTLRGFRTCSRCGLHTRQPANEPDSLDGMPAHIDASVYPKWTAREWPALGGARMFTAVPQWVPGADLPLTTVLRGIERARASEPTSATELVTIARAEERITNALVDPDCAGRKAYLDLLARHVEEHVRRWTGEVAPLYVDPVTRTVWGPSGTPVPPEAMRACESGPGIAALPAPSRLDMSAWTDEWDLLPDA